MSVALWFFFFTEIAFSFLHLSLHTDKCSLSLFLSVSPSFPPSFLLRALQNNFFRLMFLGYFTCETGTLVGVKWAKSQNISHIPNWLSLTYTISPPPQKPFSEMISQKGNLHLNWSLWSTRKKNKTGKNKYCGWLWQARCLPHLLPPIIPLRTVLFYFPFSSRWEFPIFRGFFFTDIKASLCQQTIFTPYYSCKEACIYSSYMSPIRSYYCNLIPGIM